MSSVKVSVNILSKNRAPMLKQALLSVEKQSFKDYEIVVVNDGSTDETKEILENLKIERFKDLKIITHTESIGITASRQEALLASEGEYIVFLDDDDQWLDPEKLNKQVSYLDQNKDAVLCGGAIKVELRMENYELRIRPQVDQQIRRTMLFRNNFFTSTVMFRRDIAMKAGGFKKDEDDFAEDYDLWLRMGKLGKMYNFQEAFTLYRIPNYNKARFKAFLNKQIRLIDHHHSGYPGYWLAKTILEIRVWINF